MIIVTIKKRCGVNKRISRVLSILILTVMISSSILCGFTAYAEGSNNSTSITVSYPYYAFIEDPENPWQTDYDALDSTGTIEYSDDFFSEPSPGDHPKLRALSYALALAGYENQADGYPGTDPSNSYPKLKNMLDQMGFSDYQSWDIASESDGHSMGATIGHIPESIMPILKSLIPEDEEEIVPKVPNTGRKE